jgi:hypothetical protein
VAGRRTEWWEQAEYLGSGDDPIRDIGTGQATDVDGGCPHSSLDEFIERGPVGGVFDVGAIVPPRWK